MIRVLHVVGRMNRGGVETWLMHVLRSIDRREFRMDFLVHSTEPGAYDREIRALGSKVIPCLRPRRPWIYARNFKRILREHGPYDVVHSHVHHYSGYVVRLAQRSGVPTRIAHGHNDTVALQASARRVRRAYLALMERWISGHATAGLACSAPAGASLFGRSWEVDPRWKVLYYGIELEPFHISPDVAAVRDELGIPRGAFVVGHVGRFAEQKNHSFLLDIAAEVIRREPETRFLLVGDGPLRPAIEAKARALNLHRYLIFAGVRSDVPRLMLGAMDTFLFPSLYEGLGLVLVEAQAAGLPCLCSDGVPKEAAIVPNLVQRLPISEPASSWAERLLTTVRASRCIGPSAVLPEIERTPFNIHVSREELERVYQG